MVYGEWGFKDFLKDALRDVPMTDFPFFTLDEGLNPRIHCEEHTPQNVLDKFNG